MRDSTLCEILTPTEAMAITLAAETSDLQLALCKQIREACQAWLAKSPSPDTRTNYQRDLQQFLSFAGFSADEPERLLGVKPREVAAWRDSLKSQGRTNS